MKARRWIPQFARIALFLSLVCWMTPPGPEAAQPRAALKVSTHSGRIPLDLELRGSLSRIDLADVSSCRVRIDRTYRTPGGETLNERQEVPCTDPPGTPLSLVFRRKVLLEEPGDYALRLILTPVSGREVAGTLQEVKVYHPIEAGVKETTTRNH